MVSGNAENKTAFENGMFLKGKRLQDKILEYKATAL